MGTKGKEGEVRIRGKGRSSRKTAGTDGDRREAAGTMDPAYRIDAGTIISSGAQTHQQRESYHKENPKKAKMEWKK